MFLLKYSLDTTVGYNYVLRSICISDNDWHGHGDTYLEQD